MFHFCRQFVEESAATMHLFFPPSGSFSGTLCLERWYFGGKFCQDEGRYESQIFGLGCFSKMIFFQDFNQSNFCQCCQYGQVIYRPFFWALFSMQINWSCIFVAVLLGQQQALCAQVKVSQAEEVEMTVGPVTSRSQRRS